MNNFSPKEAICAYTGWESAECAEYRYHYGRTGIPVYSTAEGFICACPNGKKPPNQDASFGWKEASGSSAAFCKSFGKTTFVSNDNKGESP